MSVPAVRNGFAHHGDGKGLTFAVQLAYKKHEDRVVYVPNFVTPAEVTPFVGELHAFFAVLDGHNGSLMSEHASKRLLPCITASLPKASETAAMREGILEGALVDGFMRTEEELRNSGCSCIIGPPRGGSTACAVFIRSAPGEWAGPPPLQLVCANSGDSRAILCALPSVDADAGGGLPRKTSAEGTHATDEASVHSSGNDSKRSSIGCASIELDIQGHRGRGSLEVAETPPTPAMAAAMGMPPGDSMLRGAIPAVHEDAEMQYPEDSIRSGHLYPEASYRSGVSGTQSDSAHSGAENSVMAGKRNYLAIRKTYSIQAPSGSTAAMVQSTNLTPTAKELAKGVNLSNDHAAETNADEVLRIRSAGGHVAKSKRGSMEVGPLRVYPGGYAISRSLGDFDCKHIIADPEIITVTLPTEGGRIVIASDGLFGFVTTEVAAQIAQGYTWPEDAVVALMRHVSITYGILDDTSIIVVDVVGSGNRALASGWKMDPDGLRQIDIADIKAAINLDDLTVRPPGEEHTKSISLLRTFVLGERLLDALPSRKVGNPDNLPLKELYEISTLLGKGHFASVRLVKERATGAQRALKSEALASERKEVMCNELDTLVAISGKHPALPTVYATFQEEGCLHIVTDACMGGTLLGYVASQDEHSFTEDELRHVMTQLVEAVAFCHSLNIVHRDVKPDNVIMRDPPGTPGLPRIMLVDFGSAMFCFKEKSSDEVGFHGTGYYAAPEIFDKKPHGFKIDVFSIGVTLHCIVAGLPPLKRIRDTIAELRKGLVPRLPEDVSEDLISFLKQLLTADPVSRPSARAALRHPWIRAGENPALREQRREARLKKAKEEEVSRPGLRRTSSFVMAAKTTNMLQQYESQVLVVLPLLLTENQCIALYDNAKEFVAREHGGVDELAVVGAKDLENMLQAVYAPLAASQLAAVRVKLAAEGGDGDGMSVPLGRLADLCKAHDHQGYVQDTLHGTQSLRTTDGSKDDSPVCG